MAPTFIVVPQWQGSVSPRAMRLVDGAEAIRGDLPASATELVDVPVEAGDAMDTGIHRLSTILMVRERQAALLRITTDWALTVGGDCGVSLAAVEHAARRHPQNIALVWFDAHPRLHLAETSPSGGFCGMVLRAITGEGRPELLLSPDSSVPLSHIVLAGTRDSDPAEDDLIASSAITELAVDELAADGSAQPEGLLAAVRATGASQVYLHIGLDVLDPAALAGLAELVPFGLSIEDLTGLITALRGEFELAGATIAGFAPATVEAANDDMPSLLRIIGALTR
ncbi:MAG: arginase family protein [Cryobacterium sp.]